MSSITKHQFNSKNAKCANKENVSHNGKRQEMTQSSSGIDSNFDWAKKQAIDQQRKQRLVQVRQQSKEIATQIRENYRQEERRQIENVNRIKEDELLTWRDKQAGIIERNYKHCLEQIGSAHLAAARENAKEQQFDEQKEKNRQLALKRGKIAAEKLKENPKMKPTKQVNRVKEKQVITISKKIDSSPESDTSTSSTSSDSSACSVILVEDKKKTEANRKFKSATSSKFTTPPTKSKVASPVRKAEYNPLNYASANNSTATDISITDSSINETPPMITKVSDLLGRKPALKSSLKSSAHIAKTYKLDKSPVATRNVSKKTPQKPQINTVSSRLSRVIKTPTKDSGKSPIKVLPERKHFVPEFVKAKPTPASKNESSMQTTPQRKSKVQFYDHANRFSRHYDGNIELVERVQKVTPLDAWEEARRDRELSTSKQHEMLQFQKLAENRSKVALEKEKIRRDYDLMSTQLNEILNNNEFANSFVQANEMLSESRLKEIAAEKQKLMNKDVRGLLKESVPITCPKVKPNSTATTAKHRPQSGEINVAKNKPKPIQRSDSTSDSSSFLLDYVNERTNTICEDIDRCRKGKTDKGVDQTKIEALHQLLNKVNSFRRILCDEIKQNNGDVSRIDASLFLTEIDKVEEKQHAIMKDKPTAKVPEKKKSEKQHREVELSERERLLKIKETCIDEKVRELYLREKKMEEQNKQSKKQPTKPTKEKNAVAVVTTNGVETLDEIPVRIVINVNKNEANKEKATEVVVNDVKWAEKLKKSSKENVSIVPVTNGAGKSYPKTPARPMDASERKHVDISSESSTFTAYFSPPNQIHTNLSRVLQKSAIGMNANQSPIENAQINDTELLHYIIRMLGMSRTSIEQLNMTSISTVQTPNSSVVNISSNQQLTSSSTSTPISHHSSSASIQQLRSVDKAKLQQLARFLAENNDLGNKTRKNSKESGASSGIWDDILSKKNDPTSKSEKTETEKPKQVKIPAQDTEDSDDKLSRVDLIAKYDELAASCTKRIINLDSMISKVREEKQKLLENTLSSASSLMTGQREVVTEYLDYPQPETAQPAQQVNNNSGSTLSDSKGTNAPSSDFSSTSGTADTSIPIEHRNGGLFATRNKPFGESKDSGVGNSRPVTSSDYRESPDLRQNAKATDADTSGKLLQNALQESKKTSFEPFLKDIPKINYRMSTDGQHIPEHEKSPEQIPTNGNARDKTTKQTPPVALTRYSPHMEDDLPHELSTITEVDTPATSRLNATDATIGNDTTLKNNVSVKFSNDNEMIKLLYNVFPNFKDYVKANSNLSQMSMMSVNDTSNVTAGSNTLMNEKIEKLLEPIGSQAEQFKYKTFEGDAELPALESRILNDSELRMSYVKFPSHTEYAKSVSGLLTSQSIEQVQLSNSNENSESSLPDIVNELKSRQIIDHSFAEGNDNDDNSDDLLMLHGDSKNVTSRTTETIMPDSLSDVLEHELNSMGLKWATAEMKKTRAVDSSSHSSDSMNVEPPTKKQISPNKPRSAKRTHRKMDQSKVTNDSFVDKNLVAANTGTAEGTTITHQTDSDLHLNPNLDLKEFLARAIMKNTSSSSSSSDSSAMSMFLKSFLGHSIEKTPDTPQNRIDKHRTSTPVDHSSDEKGDSSSKQIFRPSSTIRYQNKDQTESPTFFSNESQLSSVRMSTSETTMSDEQHK